MLQWAHENGCPWDENTCVSAAKKGNLDILKWARLAGAPWNRRAVKISAESYGHQHILYWLEDFIRPEV